MATSVTVTIPSSSINSDLTDFPLTFPINSSTGVTGLDLTDVFTQLSGATDYTKLIIKQGSTQLYAEVEKWDPTNGEAVLHIKVPTVSSSANTEITVSFAPDNSDQSSYIDVTGSTPAQQVWDSYFVAVYHMGQDPSGGADCILDSTSNLNHATPYGMSSSDSVQGILGQALTIGSGKYLDCGSDTSLDTIGTVEVSFYNLVGLNGGWGGITSKATGNTDRQEIYVSTLNDPLFGYNGVYDPTGCTVDYAGDEAWHTLHFTNTGTAQSMYVDGSLEYETSYTASTTIGTGGNFRIGAYLYSGKLNYTSGIVDEVRISSVDRTADWVATTNLSLRDNLVIISSTIIPSYSYSDLSSSTPPTPAIILRKIIDLPYELTEQLRVIVDLVYSIKLAKIIDLEYGDYTVLKKIIDLRYSDYTILRKLIDLKYGNTPQLRKQIEFLWDVRGQIKKIIDLPYHITNKQLKALIELNYDLSTYDSLRKSIDLIYAISQGGTIEENTYFHAVIPSTGYILNPFHFNIEIDEDMTFIDIELQTLIEEDYVNCVPLPIQETEVHVTVNSDTYVVLVEERNVNERIEQTTFILNLSSPAVVLQTPYAETLDEELTGNASDIVRYLVAKESDISVQWDLLDWNIPAGVLVASGDDPLSMIRKIVETPKGIMQSAKDGTLICRPEYPNNIPDYETDTPDIYFTDQDNFYYVDSDTENKEGFNRFYLSNTTIVDDGLEIQSEVISSVKAEIKVFQVPFDESETIRLNTSGGDWISIYDNGIVFETIESEQVEIVDGKSSSDTEFPVYEVLSFEYKQADLGSYTVDESGSITCDEVDNSLVEISYKTKYRSFYAIDNNIEDVQFWPEVI